MGIILGMTLMGVLLVTLLVTPPTKWVGWLMGEDLEKKPEDKRLE